LVATLGFRLEEYFDENQQPHYIASRVNASAERNGFADGVLVTHWNRIPIAQAIKAHEQWQPGSNPEACHALAVEYMTARPLSACLPPDQKSVEIRYQTDGNPRQTIVLPWLWFPPLREVIEERIVRRPFFPQNVDRSLWLVQRTHRALFGRETQPRSTEKLEPVSLEEFCKFEESSQLYDTKFPDMKCAALSDGERAFGLIRIFDFSTEIGHIPQGPEEFLVEFINTLGILPETGLVIDIRGNPGGKILAGEYLLQTLTPRWITPERFHFLNSPFTHKICESNAAVDDFWRWCDSIAWSNRTGEPLSAGFPRQRWESDYNTVGQRYYGPVVLVVDALSYSTSDIFAAGFQDHEIGTILGTSGNMGAGGANNWYYEEIESYNPGPGSPAGPLPKGVDLSIATRQSHRVRKQWGMPVEERGLMPQQVHLMTQRDVRDHNYDLLKQAADLVKLLRIHRLQSRVQSAGEGIITIALDTLGIDRIDVTVDGRPRASVDVTENKCEIKVEGSVDSWLELRGFEGKTLVAVKRFRGSL